MTTSYADQLAKWETVLKPRIFKLLVQWTARRTKEANAKTGYDIPRGTNLDSFVQNLMLGHKPESISAY